MLLLRRRRLLVALGAVALMLVLAAAQRREEAPVHLFRVTPGLKDKKATDWTGQVAVDDGEVTQIDGWRFEARDKVDGVKGWKCQTHAYILPGRSFPPTPASGKNPPVPRVFSA
jgi:hypothetical protein